MTTVTVTVPGCWSDADHEAFCDRLEAFGRDPAGSGKTLLSALWAGLDLHQPIGGTCDECAQPWPCRSYLHVRDVVLGRPVTPGPWCETCGAPLDSRDLCTQRQCPQFWPAELRHVPYWQLMARRMLRSEPARPLTSRDAGHSRNG